MLTNSGMKNLCRPEKVVSLVASLPLNVMCKDWLVCTPIPSFALGNTRENDLSSFAIRGVIMNGKDHGQMVRLNGLMNGRTYEKNWITSLEIMASLLWNVRHHSFLFSTPHPSFVAHSFRFRLFEDMGCHRESYDIRFQLEDVLSLDDDATTASSLPMDVWGYHLCVFIFRTKIHIAQGLLTLYFSQSTLRSAHHHLLSLSCPHSMNVLSVALIACHTGT